MKKIPLLLPLSFIFHFNYAIANEAPVEMEDVAMADTIQNTDPADFLEFESVLDGKCQNLSQGGKLRVMKNLHDDKPIKYRLARVFSGKVQPSLAIGVIEPNSKPKKLGCTKVDGRDQTWEIKKVKFTD